MKDLYTAHESFHWFTWLTANHQVANNTFKMVTFVGSIESASRPDGANKSQAKAIVPVDLVDVSCLIFK